MRFCQLLFDDSVIKGNLYEIPGGGVSLGPPYSRHSLLSHKIVSFAGLQFGELAFYYRDLRYIDNAGRNRTRRTIIKNM